jgi:hypothetical protein
VILSSQDRYRLCSAAAVDERTVLRLYRGGTSKRAVRERIEAAARALGLPLPGGGAPAPAPLPDPSLADVLAELRALRAEVAALRAKVGP